MMGILPYTDLYVVNACALFIAHWWTMPGLARERPVHRPSANSPSLPPAYRARLDAFDRDWHGPLLARPDGI